jgi:hypothetical protein
MHAHKTKTIVFGSKLFIGPREIEVDTDPNPWIHLEIWIRVLASEFQILDDPSKAGENVYVEIFLSKVFDQKRRKNLYWFDI